MPGTELCQENREKRQEGGPRGKSVKGGSLRSEPESKWRKGKVSKTEKVKNGKGRNSTRKKGVKKDTEQTAVQWTVSKDNRLIESYRMFGGITARKKEKGKKRK